jgi:hypothetical protein
MHSILDGHNTAEGPLGGVSLAGAWLSGNEVSGAWCVCSEWHNIMKDDEQMLWIRALARFMHALHGDEVLMVVTRVRHAI